MRREREQGRGPRAERGAEGQTQRGLSLRPGSRLGGEDSQSWPPDAGQQQTVPGKMVPGGAVRGCQASRSPCLSPPPRRHSPRGGRKKEQTQLSQTRGGSILPPGLQHPVPLKLGTTSAGAETSERPGRYGRVHAKAEAQTQ